MPSGRKAILLVTVASYHGMEVSTYARFIFDGPTTYQLTVSLAGLDRDEYAELVQRFGDSIQLGP